MTIFTPNITDTIFSRTIRFIIALVAVGLIITQGSVWANHVDWIQIDGAITPVTAKYITDAVDRAEENGAECLIIQMDTPGGLLQATFEIDKRLLDAKVPVVVYVAPSGGQAASAGTFISYAAHLVAMAPSTNIGAAHPVTMGGQDTSQVMLEKQTNDAVAHIKGLANKRGRNAVWAEAAVRQSVSITDREALDIGVINLIASNLSDLLDQIDGWEVELEDQTVILETQNAEIQRHPMDWRYRILDKISDPNIAYILMMLGFYGILFELRSPGTIFPGVVGAICLILAFFALQVLTINVAGLLLILLAILLWILEVHVPSFGLLTIGGIVSFILGSMMLFKYPEVKVSLGLIITLAVLTALFLVVGLGLALRTRFTKATTGTQGLVGEEGVAVSLLNPEGQVSVHGEVWKAKSSEKIKKGERIIVTAVDGLKMQVRKFEP
ncbi:nodulation protein NfeD [bacterium]|nr:nodulation protein NfeD [bacterium]RQV98571.1 MAG: nodulation protein NfeD [bacterium]